MVLLLTRVNSSQTWIFNLVIRPSFPTGEALVEDVKTLH